MNCVRCPTPVKSWRKYCSRACYWKSKLLIDPEEALALRESGMSFERMTAYLPACKSTIRSTINRYKACKPPIASPSGIASAPTPGSIQTGSIA